MPPYSYPSLPQYFHTQAVITIHCRYLYCMSACAITHIAPFISTTLHLATYTSVDVNAQSSQKMGLILQWRPTVATLVTVVLSLLKCLHKTGQSSSYHPATIGISVLCPIQSVQGIYKCQHHCDFVWTDKTDLLICYIYMYYFWYHLGTSHLSR